MQWPDAAASCIYAQWSDAWCTARGGSTAPPSQYAAHDSAPSSPQAKLREECCFSLILADGSRACLDFVAEDEAARDGWARHLRLLVMRLSTSSTRDALDSALYTATAAQLAASVKRQGVGSRSLRGLSSRSLRPKVGLSRNKTMGALKTESAPRAGGQQRQAAAVPSASQGPGLVANADAEMREAILALRRENEALRRQVAQTEQVATIALTQLGSLRGSTSADGEQFNGGSEEESRSPMSTTPSQESPRGRRSNRARVSLRRSQSAERLSRDASKIIALDAPLALPNLGLGAAKPDREAPATIDSPRFSVHQSSGLL